MKIKSLLWLALMAVCSSSLFAGQEPSELDRIIPPEIKNDSFYQAIYILAKTENLKHILEIGSSSGDGSTEAFVKGILENPNKPTLHCTEISKPRFNALKKRYKKIPQVHCYNVSSIPLEAFPTDQEVIDFYNTVATNLNQYGCQRVLGWLEADREYVRTAGVPTNGIELIKAKNNIDEFDLVLIDGSEFTGNAEYQRIYGARIIMLDDISAFKNYNNYHKLMDDSRYQLVEADHQLRNGYAIFKRVD